MEVTIIDKTCIQIKIDKALYSSEVIHKCFYWYNGRYSVEINMELSSFIVDIRYLASDWHIDEMVCRIKRDLIDYKTREIISNETKNIRQILIAKAFSNNDEFDESPPGNVSDPVGFEPSKI